MDDDRQQTCSERSEPIRKLINRAERYMDREEWDEVA